MNHTTLTARLGALCLVTGAGLGLVSVLLRTTLSEDASDQVAALSAHHDAVFAGVGLSSVAILVWLGGVLWLASALRPAAPRSALVGAALGVVGTAAVLFANGASAAAYAAATGLGTHDAASLLDRMGSGAEIADPFALLGDIAFIVLAIDAARAGAARWAVAGVIVGAVAEGGGFAVGSSVLAIVGFALLLVSLGAIARTMLHDASRTAARVDAVTDAASARA
ncbi:MAG TPA: hypothetical protein VGK78_15440 [Nocardioides sp.]|uniref:hypothetical protein n=1 Tax=Nocardioides sp. TaxID=35761 RepID=UPI002F3E9054